MLLFVRVCVCVCVCACKRVTPNICADRKNELDYSFQRLCYTNMVEEGDGSLKGVGISGNLYLACTVTVRITVAYRLQDRKPF